MSQLMNCQMSNSVGDPSVTDESTKAFDESLELKFDIDL
jgi:hypothetical protein